MFVILEVNSWVNPKPKYLALQVSLSFKEINPEVFRAIAAAFNLCVEIFCKSILLIKSKTISILALLTSVVNLIIGKIYWIEIFHN